MPRPYNKKSSYWKQFEETNAVNFNQQEPFKSFTAGDPYYVSTPSMLHTALASLSSRTSPSEWDRTGSRINAAAVTQTSDRFSAIRAGLLPFEYSRDFVSVRDAILLCQKAYFNVSIFRRTIDLMSEMANTEIFLKGSSKKARDFFKAWLEKIDVEKLAEQYFREYYRSGNIFLYRVRGVFKDEDFRKLTQVYASDVPVGNKIPVKYVLLNPYDVVSRAATSFSEGNYEKLLTQYELARLKDPQTDEDRAFFEGLPQEAKNLIAKKSWTRDGIRIKLPAENLIFSFCKRSDYEPFAVPFGYPVLDDINAKLELKKMDMAITRTVENVILLIRTGAPPDKGGINPANVEALKSIFQNNTTGRTLISDWTTEGEFLIPDLNKVLGPDKYKIIDQDIREGLQNILLGEEKYGNTQTKVKIFLDGLKEARRNFLKIIQDEIKTIAKNLGMRTFPYVAMREVSASENTQFQRVVTRLMELGIMDAKSGIWTIQNGEFPDVEGEEFQLAQEEYVKQRKNGLWNPLSPVATQPQPAPKIDPNNLIKQPTSPSGKPAAKKKSKVLTPAGRPRDSKASISDLKESIYKTEDFFQFTEAKLAERYQIGSLSAEQKEIALEIAQKIISAETPENWQSLAEECLNDDSKLFSLQPLAEVQNLMVEHDLAEYDAALLYHSGA
ncbi:MAG: hypothetical protein FMNOHCHN_03912 [Ignavibacteriaceae bacterium]|nr:hypothetical protein [Ignavibacteriaceae bacterium]